jgi:hypothetical protein
MGEQLALWSARFEALKAQAGKDAKAEIAQQLERWHAAEEMVAAKLVELKATVGDAWDHVKLELEKAWNGIESVLNEGVTMALSRLITKEEIEALTPEQQDAILEALVIAAVADGKVARDDVARFDNQLGTVPWVQPQEEILKKAQAARARVAALANDDEKVAVLKSIAARVPQGPVAEKTLGMMALIMTADGPVSSAEQFTLSAFALAFGIDKERLGVLASASHGA